jgi:chromosome segregation ATPase
MAETAKKQPAKEKQKRTILTPAQRIEKMQAELEAAKTKEADKAKAKLASVEDAIAKAEIKVTEAQAKVALLKAEREDLQALAGVTVGEAPDTTSA